MDRHGGAFSRRLSEVQPDPAGRQWLFVPYDQLSDRIGPLSREDPSELGIILVENPWKASRRPYHKQKLALVLCNLRHFALEQAARGVAVRHVVALLPILEKHRGRVVFGVGGRHLRFRSGRTGSACSGPARRERLHVVVQTGTRLREAPAQVSECHDDSRDVSAYFDEARA